MESPGDALYSAREQLLAALSHGPGDGDFHLSFAEIEAVLEALDLAEFGPSNPAAVPSGRPASEAAGGGAESLIIGPFTEYRLVVDGYSVPFVEAREDDGGTVTFIMDSRLAWTVPAAAFESTAHLIATAYALGIGLPCAPSDEYEVPPMDAIPAVMRPRRTVEIAAVSTEGDDE